MQIFIGSDTPTAGLIVRTVVFFTATGNSGYTTVEYGGSYGYPLNVGIKPNAIVFENLKGYPNPATSKFNLEGLPDKAKLSLTNILGEEVYSCNSEAGQGTIDLSAYTAGIYYLSVNNTSGQQVIKVIKN